MRATKETAAARSTLQVRKTLADKVVDDLTRIIRKAPFKPGDLIPAERELAGRFGVSRFTVRAGLDRLVGSGLIECRPKIGYVVTARASSRGLGVSVGLIYRDLSSGGMAASKSVPAIEQCLAATGRTLMISSSGLETGREDACIRRFGAAGVCALIVEPAVTGDRSVELESWIRRGRPVVLEGHPGNWRVSSELAGRCDQVDVDNRGGVRTALEHLVELGHDRIAYVSSGPSEGSERFAAFQEFIRGRRLPERPEWTVTGVAHWREGGREAFHKFRATGLMPTAVFCTEDDTALGVIDAARAAGLKYPEDLSVIGFGNESKDGPGALAELTTLDSSREELARELVRLLEAQASGVPRSPEKVRLPMRLIQRRSCMAPMTR
jgi:LacI family transcriptional regulator